MLVTRTVDTGPGGENDPNRALAVLKPVEERGRSRGYAWRRNPPRCRPQASNGWATSSQYE